MHDEGIKLSPICMGLIVDAGGTILCVIAVFAAIAVALLAGGTAPGDLTDDLSRVSEGPAIAGVGAALVYGWTVIGGYVAGRMAPHAPLAHALLFGIAVLASGLAMWESGLSDADALAITELFAWAPAALLGGIVARNRAAPAASPAASESLWV